MSNIVLAHSYTNHQRIKQIEEHKKYQFPIKVDLFINTNSSTTPKNVNPQAVNPLTGCLVSDVFNNNMGR